MEGAIKAQLAALGLYCVTSRVPLRYISFVVAGVTDTDSDVDMPEHSNTDDEVLQELREVRYRLIDKVLVLAMFGIQS